MLVGANVQEESRAACPDPLNPLRERNGSLEDATDGRT